MVLIGLADCTTHIHQLHLGPYQNTSCATFLRDSIELINVGNFKDFTFKVIKNMKVIFSTFQHLGHFYIVRTEKKRDMFEQTLSNFKEMQVSFMNMS